jgi:hypothetical protein
MGRSRNSYDLYSSRTNFWEKARKKAHATKENLMKIIKIIAFKYVYMDQFN